MNQVEEQQKNYKVIGRKIMPDEFSGFPRKTFKVPEQHDAIQVRKNGELLIFHQGDNIYVEKQPKNDHATNVAIITTNEIVITFHPTQSLSGDKELLDIVLMATVKVADPTLFFRSKLSGTKKITDKDLEIDKNTESILRSFTQKYLAQDLIHGDLDKQALNLINLSLSENLKQVGLSINLVPMIAISLSSDRILIAERAQVINDKLRSIEIQEKFAEIETEVELREFIHEIDPEMEVNTAFATNENNPTKADDDDNIREMFTNWIASARSGSKLNLHTRLTELISTLNKDEKPNLPPPKFWWRGTSLWMILWLLLAVTLTIVFTNYTAGAERKTQLEIPILIWSATIGVELAALKRLYEKWNLIKVTAPSMVEPPSVKMVVEHNRTETDRLVRQQCVSDMRRILVLVTEARSIQYKKGFEQKALEIRGKLEPTVESAIKKLNDNNFGKAGYLTDLPITESNWEQWLDQEEEILLRSSNLVENCESYLENSTAGEITSSDTSAINNNIAVFLSKFYARNRSLQILDDRPLSAKPESKGE